MDTKAREAQAIHSLRVEFVGAVIEQCGIEANFVGGIAAELVDSHRSIEVQPQVEERDLERQLGIAPECALGDE